MTSEERLRQLAQIIIGALDVDMQLLQGKLLAELRDTPYGEDFAEWARQNPVIFETFVHGLSALAQRTPRDGSLLRETVVNQLRHLPAEFHRAVFDETEISRVMDDEAFQQKYSEAVKGLPDENLSKVARLNRRQLQEWVNSPKEIRPHLLQKWDEAPSRSEILAKGIEDAFKPVRDAQEKLDADWAKRVARGELHRGRRVARKEKLKQLPWWKRPLSTVTVTDEEAWQAIGYDDEESFLNKFKESSGYQRL